MVKIAYAAYTNRLWIVLSLKPCLFLTQKFRGYQLALLSSKLLAHLLVIVAAPAIELNGYLKLQRSSMATCPTPNMTTMPWVGVGSWFEKTSPQKKFDFQDLYVFFVYIYVSLGNGWKWCHNHRPNKWWSCTSFNTKVGSHQLSPVILDTFNLNLRQIPIILSRQQNGHHMPSWSAETNCCSKDHWPSQEPKLIIGCTYHIYIDKDYFSGLNFREYPHKRWPYMVLTYLHVLDPEIPIETRFPSVRGVRWGSSPLNKLWEPRLCSTWNLGHRCSSIPGIR